MSKKNKTILIIVIILAVLLIAYFTRDKWITIVDLPNSNQGGRMKSNSSFKPHRWCWCKGYGLLAVSGSTWDEQGGNCAGVCDWWRS